MRESLDNTDKSEYWCEVCGRKEQLTQQEAFDAGWDYPPFIGEWGVVSPRTCGECPMADTAYWAIVQRGSATVFDIPSQHMETIKRIVAEVPQP